MSLAQRQVLHVPLLLLLCLHLTLLLSLLLDLHLTLLLPLYPSSLLTATGTGVHSISRSATVQVSTSSHLRCPLSADREPCP